MDYQASEYENQELENEYFAGDLHEEEYTARRWPESDLCPAGGRVAEPRMAGPGVCRPHSNPVILPLPEGVRVRGHLHLLTRAAHHGRG